MNSNKKKRQSGYDEALIDDWLVSADLGKLSSTVEFKKVKFPNLKPTAWDDLYSKFQKSKPVSIRLPEYMIHQLKLASIEKGIAYQTLIKLWISEKLNLKNG
jgi:predicted DNA binding CopG/RHH family protein